MTKSRLAPPTLLAAALAACAAVFAIHHVESRIGPFNEPYVTQLASPDGDRHHDDAIVRFTTKRREHVTIRLVDSRSHVVKTIRHAALVHGGAVIPWQATNDAGHVLADGEYRIQLTRAGDSRVYGPAKPIVIDTVPLRARLVVARRRGDALGGLVYTEAGIDAATLELADHTTLRPAFSTPDQSAAASLPTGRPHDLYSVRFLVRGARTLDLRSAVLVIRDSAGNATRLPLDGTLEEAGDPS
ncbi:MAG: hypothetical protein JWN41_501 [Thermoleophilia bacterium]|nr:hypothetical protein [Thermoleophilia bacterium]